MGTVEFLNEMVRIHSHIITYGNASSPEITEGIRAEIEEMWNEPDGFIFLKNNLYKVRFEITAEHAPLISPMDIYQNVDARNNYFRIEEFSHHHISFVDDLGCNSGYFKLDNLYKGSTTAAHEYGHTLGLSHPRDLDIRHAEVPGIMYPRGTLVKNKFQYNEAAISGDNTQGGTMHPKYRKVRQEDIENLRIPKLSFEGNSAIIGAFTNVWHPNHRTIPPQEVIG